MFVRFCSDHGVSNYYLGNSYYTVESTGEEFPFPEYDTGLFVGTIGKRKIFLQNKSYEKEMLIDIPDGTKLPEDTINEEDLTYSNGNFNTHFYPEVYNWVKELNAELKSNIKFSIPSINELELIYRYCKPTSNNNDTTKYGFVYEGYGSGYNPSSCPIGNSYIEQVPGKASNIPEEYSLSENIYYSSTISKRHINGVLVQDMRYGSQLNVFRFNYCTIRLIRSGY
jgi:hypothetical protein